MSSAYVKSEKNKIMLVYEEFLHIIIQEKCTMKKRIGNAPQVKN